MSGGEKARHAGEPLSAEQIRALPNGAQVVVTWSGGNGPWLYEVWFAPEDSERLVPWAVVEGDERKRPYAVGALLNGPHRITLPSPDTTPGEEE